MKIKFVSFLIILLAIIYNCKKDSAESSSEKPVLKSEKKQESVIELSKEITKPFDSITNKNAIDFLIAYNDVYKENKVRLKTRLGNIIIQLYDDTPLHRANFIFLTKVGYFNTTCFHRVVPNFIAQGGNSESSKTLRIRNKYQNYTIPPEFRAHRKHKYGAVAGSRDWDNNISKKSNPFEFYIVQSKTGAHHLDGDHTVFGEVISGFHVLDKIANLKAGKDEWPYDDVFIEMEVIE